MTKRNKGQTMTYNTLHKKLKDRAKRNPQKLGVNSGALEG